MKKLTILLFVSIFMVSCIKHKSVVLTLHHLTDKEYIEKEEKEFEESVETDRTELSYYKKGFQAVDEGNTLSAIGLFQIVVDMEGEKAENARLFIKILKKDLKDIKRFNIFRQKDKELKISSEEPYMEIKSWISVVLNDQEIPKQMAVFLGRVYKNLLKQGFTKIQAMRIMTETFKDVSIKD